MIDDYACEYPDKELRFLVGYTDGKLTHWDGPWREPQEIAQALALRRKLNFRSIPDFWRMISIQNVPELIEQPEFNIEAIESCNEMLDSFFERHQ